MLEEMKKAEKDGIFFVKQLSADVKDLIGKIL